MRDFKNKGLFWYWGLKMYKFRWAVATFWVLLFIISVFFAQQLPDRLKDSGFIPKGSESDHGITLMQKKLGIAPSIINIVYTSPHADLTSYQAKKEILQSLHPLNKLDYIKNIQINQTPRLKKKKGIQSVVVELSLKSPQALNHFTEVRRLITQPVGMNVYIDGNIATLYDTQRAIKQDLAHSEIIGLPIALIVLLFIFGTFWAALLPLMIGIMSVSLTLGLTYYLTGTYSLSNFLPNIVMMLGLAIGVDYALFLVSRFREELKQQRAIEEAVAMTIQTAGKSIFFSGFTVLIGMIGMLFINLPIIYSICLGGVLVVLSAVILSCTLLPSLFGIFGRRINSLKVFPRVQMKMENSRLWERIANKVMRRPAFLAILICTLLFSLMLPITQMKLGVPTADVLPPSYESRIGADILKNNYDQRKANPILIILKAKRTFADHTTLKDIESYEDKIKKIPGIKEVRSYVDLLGPVGKEEHVKSKEIQERILADKLARGNFVLMTVVPSSDPESTSASKLVHQLRGVKVDSLKPYITGQTALRVDMLDRIYHGLPLLMLFITTVTYFVLFFAFKSVLIPLKAVLMNALSLGASLGIVVLVFQYGLLADTLNITSIGYVSIIMPVTIFCIVFGISMDYEVFLISRIKEEYDLSRNSDQSTAFGLQKTGSLISSAALILMVIVGSFMFTNIEITKALGVGLFCAIFIDATLIRIIVVPALMKLLGPANWWAPRWLSEGKFRYFNKK